VVALEIYWKPVVNKQQLEKLDFELKEAKPTLPAHLRTEVYFDHNYDILFSKYMTKKSKLRWCTHYKQQGMFAPTL